ncbi:hypothetical protein GCM10011584_23550 [Nocardioides phosphati]|uniref:Secreted protein n=1 Tax=Nocardioides phosphati TaxID=1867775 RepID=A0ABQ2NCH4_9ACTN|nr:hypothetical protein [Nocardioides phosphati]GGO90837.1 hypothetical protein GCM10011584_23550 [Nocardioides phosphati]
MNSLSRRLLAVAGAAALSVGLATPAQAEQWAHNDARGDVTVSSGCDDSGSNCTDAVDATQAQPDVLRVVATHTTDRVKVTARYAELGPGLTKAHVLRVVTNEGLHRHFAVVTDSGHVVVKEMDRDSDGSKVSCTGLRQSIDYTANTVAMSIPRSCLSSPRWVRVGFGTQVVRDISDLAQGYKSDDGLRSGLTASTSDLVLGPELSRG